MIRYVLAVLLATALVGLGFVALEEGAKLRGESQVEAQVASIEEAVVSMVENDTPVPAEQGPPRRVVELDLPEDTLTSERAERFVLEPDPEAGRTVARYRFEGRAEKTVVLDGTLVNATGGGALVLDGASGSYTLTLTYVLDGDEPEVEASVR